MSKKSVIRLLFISTLTLLMYSTVFASDGIKIYINDTKVTPPDALPEMKNDHVFVPLRFICETLSYEVNYDEATKEAVVEDKFKHVIGSFEATLKDGNIISVKEPSYVKDGKTMVSIRLISEALDCFVDWDDFDKRVIIEAGEYKDWYYVDTFDKKANNYPIIRINKKTKEKQPFLSGDTRYYWKIAGNALHYNLKSDYRATDLKRAIDLDGTNKRDEVFVANDAPETVYRDTLFQTNEETYWLGDWIVLKSTSGYTILKEVKDEEKYVDVLEPFRELAGSIGEKAYYYKGYIYFGNTNAYPSDWGICRYSIATGDAEQLVDKNAIISAVSQGKIIYRTASDWYEVNVDGTEDTHISEM